MIPRSPRVNYHGLIVTRNYSARCIVMDTWKPDYSHGEQLQAGGLGLYIGSKSAASMARFPEAEKRLLEVRICMKCNARNGLKAIKCRKCSYKGLRLKNKERRI